MQEQAKARAMNAFFSGEILNSRYFDDNGFLHITLRFMRTGLLKYAPTPETFPDGVPPDAIGMDGYVTVLVEPDDLAEPESLASLEGLDCLRSHAWATPEGNRDDVGSVAGTPQFDGEFVTGEAVIKDEETIRRLQLSEGASERLAVVSAGYSHVIDWEAKPYFGKEYAGRQRTIRYNHFVLLPEGEGRCGNTVCVMNSKEKKVTENEYVPFWSRVFKKKVYARNEQDAEEIIKKEAEAEAENEAEAEEHEKVEIGNARELLAKLTESNQALESMQAENEELKAQLAEIKARIEKEIGADEIEAKADEIAGEREEVAEVMDSNGVMEKAKAMNALKEHKLHGMEAKVFAMNALREKTGRKPMTKEQAQSAIAVNAMWDVIKDSAPQKKIAVGGVFTPGTAMNTDERKAMQEKTLHGLGFRKK